MSIPDAAEEVDADDERGVEEQGDEEDDPGDVVEVAGDSLPCDASRARGRDEEEEHGVEVFWELLVCRESLVERDEQDEVVRKAD